MSRRIEIELTSSRPDGTWTWRAAGAREPKGILQASIIPQNSKTGDLLKVEADFNIDGITIVSVVQGRIKVDKVETIALKGNDKPFEAVTQQLARKEKNDRGDRRDRPSRGDRPSRDGARGERPPRDAAREGTGPDRRPRRDGAPTTASDKTRTPRRPHFEAPPELPQRPRAKRLKPLNVNRKAVLSELPEEQRSIAELALQGMQTVRQRIKDANLALAEQGKPIMPEQAVVQMAENLLPRLRVAEWLDRAQSAKRDLAELDLGDLRSVVSAASDPLIERSESCRELIAELRSGLTARAEQDYQNWLQDIEASLGVGRIVRALKLSGQPPKAGAIFPDELGRRLAVATSLSLVSDAPNERWIAVLEAVAFAPIRSLIIVTSKPDELSVELTKTVQRLSALIPQIALALGVDVTSSSHTPKPLRAVRPIVKKLPPKPPTAPVAATSTPTPEVAEAAHESPAQPEVEIEGAIENEQTPAGAEVADDAVVEPVVD
ncbi:MAG: hypothetical protein WCG40_00540 [Actinomycetes bacterium]